MPNQKSIFSLSTVFLICFFSIGFANAGLIVLNNSDESALLANDAKACESAQTNSFLDLVGFEQPVLGFAEDCEPVPAGGKCRAGMSKKRLADGIVRCCY